MKRGKQGDAESERDDVRQPGGEAFLAAVRLGA